MSEQPSWSGTVKSVPLAETKTETQVPKSIPLAETKTETKENTSVDPERQKNVSTDYRKGWEHIWEKKG